MRQTTDEPNRRAYPTSSVKGPKKHMELKKQGATWMGRKAVAVGAALVSIVGLGAALTGPLGGAPAQARARVQFEVIPSDTTTTTVPTPSCTTAGGYGWGNVARTSTYSADTGSSRNSRRAHNQEYGWGNSVVQPPPCQ
jgi:hypothetical protein